MIFLNLEFLPFSPLSVEGGNPGICAFISESSAVHGLLILTCSVCERLFVTHVFSSN